MKNTTTAPDHLQPSTQAWWVSVVDDYDLEPHHIRLLTLAGEAWDRIQEARQRLAEDGLTVETSQGIKSHPCVAIERDSRAAFARLVQQLGLDEGEKRSPGRPPMGGVGVTYEQLNGLPPRVRSGRKKKGSYGYDRL